MRQVAPRNADGGSASQRAQRFSLWWHYHARITSSGRALDITSVFEAVVGENAVGAISDEELKRQLECAACPGEGSCAGMFTANTMASVGEALGMSLLGSAVGPVDRSTPRPVGLHDSGTAVLPDLAWTAALTARARS